MTTTCISDEHQHIDFAILIKELLVDEDIFQFHDHLMILFFCHYRQVFPTIVTQKWPNLTEMHWEDKCLSLS